MIQVGNFTSKAKASWGQANRTLLWGWKRDVGVNSRAVFFSGELANDGNAVFLGRHYLFYQSTMATADAGIVHVQLELARQRLEAEGLKCAFSKQARGALVTLKLEVGAPTAEDEDKVRRLCRRRPRRALRKGDFPPYSPLADLETQVPTDLYVGSGISYEAGLPTLCDMHDIFGVDSEQAHGFAGGSDDPLPTHLSIEGRERFRHFCRTHVLALEAEPTPAMRIIADLQARGLVRKVFTDNVDNMLAKAGVEFERVRGSGVFNERYPAQFGSRRLIVIGVAADRRQLVRQARGRRMAVTIVNPIAKVSPNVTHLDYVRRQDTFYKATANEFFAALHAAANSTLTARRHIARGTEGPSAAAE